MYDGLKVTLERAPQEANRERVSLWRRIATAPFRLFETLINTCRLIRHAELRKPLSARACPRRWLNSFSTLFFTSHVTACPHMMKAVLKFPRNEGTQGLFQDRENARVFLPLLKDLFPDDHITADDFLFTCHQKMLSIYREPILKFIGPANIRTHLDALAVIVDENLQIDSGSVNTTELAMIYSTHVISRLLLGHPGPLNLYREISQAISVATQHVMKSTWKRPISESDKAKYVWALDVIRKAVTTTIQSREKPILGSFLETLREDKKMTDGQIKTTLFLMYLAGSETTASLLNYLVWQLARHPDHQQEIHEEIQRHNQESLSILAQNLVSVERFYAESIRLFTPVYVIGRQPADDLLCTIRDNKGKTVYRQRIVKEEGLLCTPTFAARDPEQFENPDDFNPHRFARVPKNFPWLPFAEGAHFCPGQWLARAEVLLFVTGLIKRYSLALKSNSDRKQKGYMTLKLDGEVWVEFRSRFPR
jgi:cytochrome P450